MIISSRKKRNAYSLRIKPDEIDNAENVVLNNHRNMMKKINQPHVSAKLGYGFTAKPKSTPKKVRNEKTDRMLLAGQSLK